MSDTSEQAPKSSGAAPHEKLLRMLRNTLRKYPRARLMRTQEGFGASLGDGTFLWITCRGHLTPEDMRDLLALFATWLVVDPDYLRAGGSMLSGYFVSDRAE
jgi:hypothetical protein